MPESTPEEYTMAPLPRSTTARLLAVADLIEQHPERHDQTTWWDPEDWSIPTVVPKAVGTGMKCGTKACVAGWAVAFTPPAEADRLGLNLELGFDRAACRALGLSLDDLSEWWYLLFEATVRRRDLVRRLRRLAEIPTRERTYAEAVRRGIVRG